MMIITAAALLMQATEPGCRVLPEIQQRTQETLDRIRPLFARRSAIAQQKLKLETANPLSRGLKSLFNQNYDRAHLDEIDAQLAEQIKLEVQSAQLEIAGLRLAC